jgi:hypothetical protein
VGLADRLLVLDCKHQGYARNDRPCVSAGYDGNNHESADIQVDGIVGPPHGMGNHRRWGVVSAGMVTHDGGFSTKPLPWA